MRKSVLLSLIAACLPLVSVQCKRVKSYVPKGYELVWQDEFNEGTEPDASKWTHVVMRQGMVNHELQNYVNHLTPAGATVTEVKDGTLRINCFKENDRVYSGRLNGNVRTGWQYGYFEARIKLPKGKGTWPAFWMMPANNRMPNNGWPRCGEIDIMEEVGFTPNEVSSSIHTQDYNHTKNTHKNHAMTIKNAEGDFHVYSLLWTEDEIITYVDGKEQLHLEKAVLGEDHDQWPFHYPFHIILNLAWGGDWGGQEGVDEDALPVTMEVDYVRVYQLPQP
jgi:beta-glucanase (GH16 family)